MYHSPSNFTHIQMDLKKDCKVKSTRCGYFGCIRYPNLSKNSHANETWINKGFDWTLMCITPSESVPGWVTYAVIFCASVQWQKIIVNLTHDEFLLFRAGTTRLRRQLRDGQKIVVLVMIKDIKDMPMVSSYTASPPPPTPFTHFFRVDSATELFGQVLFQ